MRIDLPSSFFDHIDMNGTTQFKLSYTLSNADQFIDFKNTQDNAWLDVHYTENPHANIKEAQSISALTLFPNPSKGWIQIKSTDLYDTIEVFDLSGKSVYQCAITSSAVDLSDLKNGLYIVKLTNDEQYELSKLMIQR